MKLTILFKKEDILMMYEKLATQDNKDAYEYQVDFDVNDIEVREEFRKPVLSLVKTKLPENKQKNKNM